MCRTRLKLGNGDKPPRNEDAASLRRMVNEAHPPR